MTGAEQEQPVTTVDQRDADARPRTIMTQPAPGYVPKELTWEQSRDMAQLVAAAMTEAGWPVTTRPSRLSTLFDGDAATDWQFEPMPGHDRPPKDVMDRARALAFVSFGLTDMIEVSDRGE